MSRHRILGGLVALAAGATGLVLSATPALAACLPPQYCGPPVVVPVSRTADGSWVHGAGAISSMSNDGRYVAFSSTAALVADDTNAKEDVYRRDLQTGSLVRVSVRPDGGQGNDLSLQPSISADGRFVAFASSATNLLGSLVAPGTPNVRSVFRKDLATGSVVKVNTKSDGGNGGGFLDPAVEINGEARISGDGRYVAFTSNQTGLVATPSSNAREVYRKDLVSGSIARVSAIGTSAAGLGNGASQYPTISADGRYVAFSTDASNFATTDTNAVKDVYRKDLVMGTLWRVSIGLDGTQLTRSVQPWINADGRYVSFTVTESESSNIGSVQRKDMQTGELVTVSSSAGGVPGLGLMGRSSISGDGNLVSFGSTAPALILGDTNGELDVFVKNVTTGAIKRVSRTSSNGQPVKGGDISTISRDGQFVTFWTTTPLYPGDLAASWDIYRTNTPLNI